jgi:Protein kinase domain
MVEVKKEKGKWDSSDEEDDSEIDKRKKRKVGNVESETATSNTKPGGVDQTSQDTILTVENATEIVSTILDAPTDDSITMQEDPVGSTVNSPKPPDGAVDIEETAVITEDATAIAVKTTKVVEKYDHNPLHHGCRSVDEYIRLNFIDQGTYGVVFRARCKRTGKIYALKQVKIGKEAAKVGFPVTALRETNILLALKHPNIVR